MGHADPTGRFHERLESLPSPDTQPALLVVVDTEEEFDWFGPFDRALTSVSSMSGVGAFQEICDARGVRPTYVVTYPVATQAEGFEPLAAFHAEGRAQIGAHQHPWVCPPFEEEVNAFHSYPGNLPEHLERRKLEVLTEAIESHLGFRPTIYKAGRYGFGPHSARILEDLGYEIDLSPVGPFDLSDDGGPNDLYMPPTPFRFGADGRMCCFPATGGFVGHLPERVRLRAYVGSRRPAIAWTRLPGVLARARLVERILLSPEGFSLDEMKRLTNQLLAQGERMLTMTLHTPSLAPGHTPHVRDARELEVFLGRIRDYLTFFFDDLGGRASSPHELRQELNSNGPQPSSNH